MDLTLTLTEEDASMLMQLADAAVRAHGLQVVRQAVKMMDLLDAAAAAPQAELVPPEPSVVAVPCDNPTATTPDEDSSDA